jgi:hypothetical protein
VDINYKQQDIGLPKPPFCFHDSVNLKSDECEDVFEKYTSTIPKTNRSIVEELTRGQGKNLLWSAAREGRITSSKFGQVCLQRDDTAPDGLLKDIMGYRQVPSVKASLGV